MARRTLTSRQPTVALLEVGLQQEGDIARGLATLGHLHLEQGQVFGAEPLAPSGACLLEQRIGDLGLAPDESAIEKAERDPHVLGGRGQDLRRLAHGVVEVHALVPHRVPDGVGDGLDVPVAVVDEDHIEVAVGAQGAPPVPAHGQEGQVPGVLSGRLVGQPGEPGVRLGSVAAAEFHSHQAGLGQQGPPPFTQ